MYVRKIEDQELTFTVSGLLWRRSLIMEDEETSSQWSHLMGKAMAGELKGAELPVIPSEMTDWKTWRKQYPGTDVLDMRRTTRAFVTEMQKAPGAYTFGLRIGGAVADFPFDVIRKLRSIDAKVGEDPVLVTYEEDAATARVFRRKAGDRVLTFRRVDEALQDKETGSIWNPHSGRCTKGPLKGTKLEMLPGIPSFVKAWRTFYPGSKTFKVQR